MIRATINTDTAICKAVVGALQYYSLFQYPLSADEIHGNMQVKCSLSSVLAALEVLVEDGAVYKHEGYYCINPDVKKLVLRRKEANQLAGLIVKQAINVGKIIFRFPFVRFVGISGSLSKGYADKNSDFDFFIITREDRLWICRTLLHLLKKLTFLFGQEHKFCMNYFIDTSHMEIAEHNCFTAIELSSLIPVQGGNIYDLFEENNHWVNNFLPNGYVGFSTGRQIMKDTESILKKVPEFLFNILFPSLLNKVLMRLTDKKWRRKWSRKNYPMVEYELAFKTTLHVSKNHPANHQKRILEAISKLENVKMHSDVIA